MARFPFSFLRGPISRNRNWMYVIVSGVLVLIVIAVFLYWQRTAGQTQDNATSRQTDADIRSRTVEPAQKLAVETQPRLDATTVTREPNDGSSPDVAGLIADATVLLSAQPARVIESRDKLNAALQLPMNRQQQKFVKEQLSKLADRWLFGPTAYPGDVLCDTYTVRPADHLKTIGEQLKVPHEILMQINNIRKPEALQAGRTIKVVKGPFHAKVCRSTFTMDLYLQNTFVRTFSVGLGRPGMETPTGLWRVKLDGKLISPTWTDPDTGRTYKATDRDYPLGSRWIALDGVEGQAKGRTGFAIHGTKDPEQIGTPGSRGCIRLHNGDAILVYNLLTPGFSQVRVVE